MKSFKQILSERRRDEIKDAVETAKRMYQQSLTGSQMREKNPEATAAFEKSKGGPVRTVTNPESTIITNMPPSKTTPEEVYARLENKPTDKTTKKIVKKRVVKKRIVKPPTKPEENINLSSNRKVDLPPRQSSLTVSSSGPSSSSVNLGDTSLPKSPKTPKGSSIKISAPRSTTPSTERVTSAVKGILKAEREAKAAERAAQRASLASGASKFTKNLGRAAGLVGAGLEAKTGYETARGQGASQRTAAAIGGFRGAGALAGAATGARIGGLVAGLPGAVLGGIGGYAMGTNAADSLARGIRGDFGKQFNTKDLRRNIRNVVPYEIRSQVPANLRQDFGSFLTRAGRTYGDWRRSQRQNNNR